MKKIILFSVLLLSLFLFSRIILHDRAIEEVAATQATVDREPEYTLTITIPTIETSEEVKEVGTFVGDYGDSANDSSIITESEYEEIEYIYEEEQTTEYTYEETTEYTHEETEYNVTAFSDEDLFVFMRCVYLENGMNSEYCAYLTACVILNRYYDYGYESLSDVVFARGQFSVAGSIYNDDYINDLTRAACEHALTETDRNPHSFHMGYWNGEEDYGVYAIVDGEHFICGWY